MNNYTITPKAIWKLKKQVTLLINNYDNKIYGNFKIYLYAKYLKINYQHHYFYVTLLEYKEELFWYLTPFYDSYLLIKHTHDQCFKVILDIIKELKL